MAEYTRSPIADTSARITRRQLLASAGALLILPIIPRLARAATIVAVRTWPADEYTRVTLEMDTELKAEHFLLENPNRLVVDINGLTLSQAINDIVSKIQPNDPYISSVRVGQNRPDVVRLVLDLKQPIAPQVFTLKPIGEYKYRLVLDLYPQVAQDPLLALMDNMQDEDPLAEILENLAANSPTQAPIPSVEGQRLPPPSKVTPPPVASIPSTPKPSSPAPARRDQPLLIALDPGHGGEDPGAIGPGGTREKDVVLAIARKLKKLIDAQPNMRAYLTRDNDFFVPLHVRVQKARRVKADLFISVHADAWTKPSARGSSVYALSQRGATSAAARILAQKENQADLVGGLNLGSHNKQVAEVLLDLSTAAQINDAMRIGSQVLEAIGKINRLHKRQVERANFAVLRAPDIPSILVETAFISNPEEERLLRSPKHQDRIAEAMMAGIGNYFSESPGLARRS
ncbi:N-acetylmuramoyl-L-alanine amidase [Paracandidimonas soli]|uniref:N-acetylmuramoyl-L-alanine amidase AmiC n=1 Tax=Paracandidimonas soli TaxID=1917182 RepID=A0A4R3VHF7_9BURK|nr:N-acetylmuramoyl-L-alanine amidase [Paracandidimonas soli]TCV03262.1 N-acetylmuramoyl-L-alanine amidase [Paracandidimonas soli]